MKKTLLSLLLLIWLTVVAVAQTRTFTPIEQSSISVPTPGLFDRSSAFDINFKILAAKEYSFPLPVGKAKLVDDEALEITSAKGDIVLAMFDGYVRMSRRTPQYGNVVIIRHDNGLETVYAFNAQNHVRVGQRVQAGQKIATIGGSEDRTYCLFSIMINGGRINPATILEVNSHRLRKQTIECRKNGSYVRVSVKDEDEVKKKKNN